MKKISILLMIIVTFSGCSLADFFEIKDFENRNLSGKIKNKTFTFTSGQIKNYSEKTWRVILNSSEDYPYISFFIDKDSSPQKYLKSTFGADGIVLTGMIDENGAISYDEGELEITEITQTSIKGRIWAKTYEKNSYINGNFTANLDG